MCSRCEWINKERKKNNEEPIEVCSSEYWAGQRKNSWDLSTHKPGTNISIDHADTY